MKNKFDINRLIIKALKGHHLKQEEAEYLNGFKRVNNKLYDLPDALEIKKKVQLAIERFKKEYHSKQTVIFLPSKENKDNLFTGLLKKAKNILFKCFGK